MNIYFSGSIRGGRQDQELYHFLIEELKKYGTVLTEHIGSETIGGSKIDRQIHEMDMGWLRESDIVIAEVSTPSLGVGYEIGRAVELGHRVVCIWKAEESRNVSAMVKGSPDLEKFVYDSPEEAAQIFIKLFQ